MQCGPTGGPSLLTSHPSLPTVCRYLHPPCPACSPCAVWAYWRPLTTPPDPLILPSPQFTGISTLRARPARPVQCGPTGGPSLLPLTLLSFPPHSSQVSPPSVPGLLALCSVGLLEADLTLASAVLQEVDKLGYIEQHSASVLYLTAQVMAAQVSALLCFYIAYLPYSNDNR